MDSLKNIWHKSFQNRLTISIISTVCILMIITDIYIYSFINNIITEHANKSLEQSVIKISNEIQSSFRMIENATLLILSDPIIISNLRNSYVPQDIEKETNKKLLIKNRLTHSLLYNYAWDSELLKSVFIINNTKEYYYLMRNEVASKAFINKQLEYYDLSMQTGTHIIYPSSDYNTIYLIHEIKDLNTLRPIGKLILGLNEKILSDPFKNMFSYKDVITIVSNNKNKILHHSDITQLGNVLDFSLIQKISPAPIKDITYQNTAYTMAQYYLKDLNLNTIILVPKKQITSNLIGIISHYLLIIFISILVTIIICFLLTKVLTKSIKDLLLNIKQLKKGNFNTKMPLYKDQQLNELSIVFNTMTEEIQHLFSQVYEKQLLLRESELKSLQAQINPHFLFNVLETISWKARLSGNNDIYKMITSLGELLRANIRKDAREKITIKEELQYIEFYLYLQKKRFEDKISFTINVSHEEIYNYFVPKLCIQPIVENAVIHGLEEKMSEGYIDIRIHTENDDIIVIICDNGIGFNSNNLDFSNLSHIESRKKNHTSVGLYNSNKRIQILYGESYGISIDSKLNEYTTVTIRLPIDRSDN